MDSKKLITVVILFISTTLAAQNPLDTMAYLHNNPNVYSIIIAKNHRIVYEKFYNNYGKDSLFNDQSLTKDICSLLIGIAIDKGYLSSVDEKLSDVFPGLKNDTDKRKQQVTIRMVMNQASGLYHENLAYLPGFLSFADPSDHVLNAPLAGDPGKEWHYNNAASHLLSVIITKTTDMDTRAFADKYLFGPIGITHYDWPKMKDGYYDGSGLLAIRLSSLDMLKIGTLILDNGEYQHQQIVPKKWIQTLLNPNIHYNATWGFPASTYAFDFYHFVYKGTPVTYGMGWGGQFLVIIPSLQTVVMINENIADANAVNQSVAFTHVVFPVVFKEVTN
jgi:CubicO group peptidase (beta-lactamase class C family)